MERELSAFMAAVADLFRPEQARISAEEWLEDSELIENPMRSTIEDGRAVTIAASARLGNRQNVAGWQLPTNTKVQLLSPHTSDVIAEFRARNQ